MVKDFNHFRLLSKYDKLVLFDDDESDEAIDEINVTSPPLPSWQLLRYNVLCLQLYYIR